MQKETYRYRIKLTKLNELKFISHLDWQNLILKSLRRAGVKFALSEGFNPMPKVSYSPALPIFVESECELVNFITTEPVKTTFKEDFKNSTSENARLLEFIPLPDDGKKLESLETLVQWAGYSAKPRPVSLSLPASSAALPLRGTLPCTPHKVRLQEELGEFTSERGSADNKTHELCNYYPPNLPNKNESISKLKELEYTVSKCLSSDDLFIKKINKKGIEKNINYRSSLCSVEAADDLILFVLKAGQDLLGTTPALRADEFVKACFGELSFDIKRTHLFDKDLKVI